jgi:hypothetical protein
VAAAQRRSYQHNGVDLKRRDGRLRAGKPASKAETKLRNMLPMGHAPVR